MKDFEFFSRISKNKLFKDHLAKGSKDFIIEISKDFFFRGKPRFRIPDFKQKYLKDHQGYDRNFFGIFGPSSL